MLKKPRVCSINWRSQLCNHLGTSKLDDQRLLYLAVEDVSKYLISLPLWGLSVASRSISFNELSKFAFFKCNFPQAKRVTFSDGFRNSAMGSGAKHLDLNEFMFL